MTVVIFNHLTGRDPVRASEVAGEEHDRLWQRWAAVNAELDGYAGLRSTETPVIVLEPREGAEPSTATV